MQKFLDFISSKKFRNTLCFVVFTTLMTTTIFAQHYFFQNIIEDGISKRNIYAPKDITVVDTNKTKLLRDKIAGSVVPVVTQSDDDFIISTLSSLQKSVVKVRSKDVSDKVKAEDLGALFDEVQQKGVVDYILNASDDDIDRIFYDSSIVLQNVLAPPGISAKDFEDNNVTSIIKKNIPSNIPKTKVNVISAILNQVIVPNLVIDETATNIAIEYAKANVKEVEKTFKKGEKIVTEEGAVSQVKRDALRAAGYNIIEVNFGGIFGVFLLTAFFTFVFLQYEKNFEKQYYNAKHMLIMASFTFFTAFVAAVIPTSWSSYLVPIPMYTMLLSIFTTPRNAFFASTILLALLSMGMYYNVEVIVTFMLLNTVVMLAVSRLKFLKRSDLLLISLKISLAGFLIVGGIYFIEYFMMDIDNMKIMRDLLSMLGNCFIISGILLLGMLPIIENLFGIMTPYGLAELSESSLLKKLLQDAPGTYNHSLIVSQLCEAAAESIGANPILARVGAMYHDVGKLMRPMFFVENQSFYGIDNPHKTCTPRFSKMLITAHPKDGMEVLKEYRIPSIISNFVLQHHGTSLVSYFYNEALKEEGIESVKEEQFRYPGPKPNMKETAILMIADAVESAVRAAKNPSSEEIEAIIDKIIKERLNDGQLEESPLTLKDLKTIAEAFARMLRGMYHKRIKYHNDLVQELDKNNQINIPDEPVIPQVMDADLESKIKELENKKNDGN